jgi:hypothetical protein
MNVYVREAPLQLADPLSKECYKLSVKNVALLSTQLLTEMSTRNIPVCKADNLTAICEPFSRTYGRLDVSGPDGPPRPVDKDGFNCYRLWENSTESKRTTSI